MGKHLVISNSNELVRIAPERIVYINAEGNYSTIMQTDNGTCTVTAQLGDIEKIIDRQLGNEGKVFIRIGRSLIINSSYIYRINITTPSLVMSDAQTFTHTVKAAKEALKQLKELIEQEAK